MNYQKVAVAKKTGTPLDPRLARACARLIADGYTVCEGASYMREDGSVYVSSVETRGPNTFGAPAYAVEIEADGRMSIRNKYV